MSALKILPTYDIYMENVYDVNDEGDTNFDHFVCPKTHKIQTAER